MTEEELDNLLPTLSEHAPREGEQEISGLQVEIDEESGEMVVKADELMLQTMAEQSFVMVIEPLLQQNALMREALQEVARSKKLTQARNAAGKALQALPTPVDED